MAGRPEPARDACSGGEAVVLSSGDSDDCECQGEAAPPRKRRAERGPGRRSRSPRLAPARHRGGSGTAQRIAPLGMPARMVYYHICHASGSVAPSCAACQAPFRRIIYGGRGGAPEPHLCLGFQKAELRSPSWVHASPRCLQEAALPSVPRGRVLFSPQVSARDRGVLLQALLTINIGVNCFSLVRVRPWVYRPALMQFWANDGRPYPGGLSVPRWDRSSSSSAIDSPEACARRQIDATAPGRALAGHELEGREDLCCAVCHEELKLGDWVRRLPCEHLFHDECIVPWLLLRPCCPLDRRALDDAPPL